MSNNIEYKFLEYFKGYCNNPATYLMCLKNVSSEPVRKRHLPAEVSTLLKHAYSSPVH